MCRTQHHTTKLLLLALVLLICGALNAALIINENIQNWEAHASYGSYTQDIDAGTVSMTRCLVSPGAAANGFGSPGRIQMEASTGIVEFPELNSCGEVEFNLAAGSTGRSVKLQRFFAGSWIDQYTFSGINATGAKFYFRVNQNLPTKLRLALPSHAIYVYDIFVTDYNISELPIISLPISSNITYSSVQMNAVIENGGSSGIAGRGFCYDTDPLPGLGDGFVPSGYGISPMQAIITELNPDTDYYIRAYASNSSGTGFSDQVMIRTLAIGQPTQQTTNLVFYPGNTSVQALWTPGNGSRRLIKINTSNSFADPVDGVEYPVQTVYAGTGEQVVYCDATQIIEGDQVNAVTVTGLQRNTVYWFRAYELNGSGTGTIYLTGTAMGNPSSCTTMNTGLAGYYDNVNGYGAELRVDLHNLLRSTHLTQFSYDALWQQLQYTDEDSTNTNNIIQTYTGWSIPKNYYGGGTTQWNREHTWSVSHGSFGTTRPAGTDLHHIRPCDVTVNSAKGNKDFDNGGNLYIDASPYPGYDATTGCYTSTYAWEPRPIEKGDVARMMFYMALRYEGVDTTYDLELQDAVPTTGSFYGKLSTLLQWHFEDPPDGWERRRNDRIQERQGNRNPFIDNPDYVYRLWVPHLRWAVGNPGNTVVLNWTHALNATGYRLDVSTDSLFTELLVQDYEIGYQNQAACEVGDTDIVYVRLKAFFGSGYSPWSNVLRVDMNAPAVVISYFNVTPVGEHNALLEWTSETETGIMGYNIYRNNSNILDQAVQVNISLIPATNTSTMQNYDWTDDEIPQSETGGWVYYWLSCLGVEGNVMFIGPDSIYVSPSGVTDENQVPGFVVLNSYPNPFRETVYLDLDIKANESATVGVYNLKGQCIKKWDVRGSGKQQLIWNGSDNSGRLAGSGVYFVKVSQGNKQYVRKLVKVE